MGKNLCTQAGGERATPSYPFIFSTPSFFFVPHPLARKNGQTVVPFYTSAVYTFRHFKPLCLSVRLP